MAMINVSEKKRAANRANAQKSTGPRTPQGKAISRMNAVEHGFRSRDVVVPMLGESADGFSDFFTAVVDDLNPQNAVQSLLAEEFAANFWRLRRARRLQTGVELSVTYDLYHTGRTWDRDTKTMYSYWDDPEKNYPENVLRQTVELFARTRYLTDFFFRVGQHEQRLSNSVHRSLARYYKTVVDLDPDAPEDTESTDTHELTHPEAQANSPTSQPISPTKSTPPIAAILALFALLLGALVTRASGAVPQPTHYAAPHQEVASAQRANPKVLSLQHRPAPPPSLIPAIPSLDAGAAPRFTGQVGHSRGSGHQRASDRLRRLRELR